MSSRSNALRQALSGRPDDVLLRTLLAESLLDEGDPAAALVEYEVLVAAGTLPAAEALAVGELALEHGRVDVARACVEVARAGGVVEGVPVLEGRIAEVLRSRGLERVPARDAPPGAEDLGPEPVETTTFDRVGGMGEVKKTVHRLIILPRSRPELFERYGRRAGGGILVYGPPGCGKTLLARATAGECGVPFVNVRIEDVVDPYLGVSERNLHTAFERARLFAPAVLFLDELDALAFARHRSDGTSARRIVDVLLQELDAIGAENRDLLVLAATNAPWDVDEAVLRPGRFDRRIFVPPPDEPARREVLSLHVQEVHQDRLDVRRVAAATPLYSGADLRAVVEAAVDALIDEALTTGQELPLTTERLLAAVDAVRPTTVDWLRRAQNYVEFANEGDRYADVADYLRSREVRRRLSR